MKTAEQVGQEVAARSADYTHVEAIQAGLTFHEEIALLVEHMRGMPQTECPVTHRFAPGVYLREIYMPADTVVIGKIHKTEHFNIILAGVVLIVHDDGSREEIVGPCTFVSKAGVQKVLYIIEPTFWQTVHVTDETDLARLEEILISKDNPSLSEAVRTEILRIAQEREGVNT